MRVGCCALFCAKRACRWRDHTVLCAARTSRAFRIYLRLHGCTVQIMMNPTILDPCSTSGMLIRWQRMPRLPRITREKCLQGILRRCEHALIMSLLPRHPCGEPFHQMPSAGLRLAFCFALFASTESNFSPAKVCF